MQFNAMDPREENVRKVIEGCRALIATLASPSHQPLEREACYVLSQMLKLQAEALGLFEHPDVKQFLSMQETRVTRAIRRYPDDFIDGLLTDQS